MTLRELAFVCCVFATFNVPAQCQFGPEQCKPGFVWREAFPGDHVCVTGATRSQVVSDNSQAAARKQAGIDWCVSGFVWREAAPSDHVCVSGTVRAARGQTIPRQSVAGTRNAPDCPPSWATFSTPRRQGRWCPGRPRALR